jgi:type II secretory pathway component PulM
MSTPFEQIAAVRNKLLPELRGQLAEMERLISEAYNALEAAAKPDAEANAAAVAGYEAHGEAKMDRLEAVRAAMVSALTVPPWPGSDWRQWKPPMTAAGREAIK